MPNKDQNNKAKARARELIKWCKELRHYKHEAAMQKLNEEFRLKQEENAMEICRGFLEQYETGTLFKEEQNN